ncbi:MAG TPA: YceI family protein [Rhodopila sp.]|uniref:YceI family protein n=1 Tax=Rhodopila sp. TaxID=2480087 RepID=UPI002BB01A9F|nr:YceI family protein [Rhodopila sp.]HVY17521.1 YceI family protein [Rhodopila sp.]
MRLIVLLLLLCAPVLPTPASAAELDLHPPSTEVSIRAYGLGFLPFDGKFTRFHGVMQYDQQQPGKCQVMLEIDPSSLRMSSQSITDRVTGPDFMDVAHFPAMAFSGACTDRTVSGTLDLHGQTHPFDLELRQSKGRLTATGRLRRSEWGMTAEPFRVGRTIRIRVELPAPGEHA